MAFKNALKLLINKFGLVWILLLYILVFVTLIFFSSLPFVIPLIKAIKDAGIGVYITGLFDSIMNGENITVVFSHIYTILQSLKDLLAINKSAALNTILLLVIVFGFICRFFVGLYEIPLTKVLEGAMSSNARVGFMTSFISCLGKSSVYILVKMIYTVAYDVVFYFIIYQLFTLFGISAMLNIFLPFIIMVVFIILIAFRYTLISMWSPAVIVGQKGIFRGFGFSVKRGFKNFAAVYSTFVIAWMLLIAFNVLVGLFTFGAGLLITIPISMLFVCLLNMTIFYSKNDRRYYVDTTVINPPPSKI